MANLGFNKKGSILDLVLAMMTMLLLSIIVIILVFFFLKFKTGFMSTNIISNGVNVTAQMGTYLDVMSNTYQMLYWMLPFLILSMFLGMAISSFLVKTNPIFFIVYIFIYVLSCILSPIFSNIYEMIASNPSLSEEFAKWVIVNYIFLYLPYWIIVFGAICGILVYSNVDWGNG
jgi:hypothetical protein